MVIFASQMCKYVTFCSMFFMNHGYVKPFHFYAVLIVWLDSGTHQCLNAKFPYPKYLIVTHLQMFERGLELWSLAW